ncbi:hypothetical protein GWG65_21885 [Bradyrhizobium sp. CSA207]|nr:hypothetical protein [Bradyrhizobium sp. CSA207]
MLPRVQAKAVCRPAPSHASEQNDLGFVWLPSLAGAAMNRFVHRIIMSVLLVAVLAIIWNVLGTR